MAESWQKELAACGSFADAFEKAGLFERIWGMGEEEMLSHARKALELGRAAGADLSKLPKNERYAGRRSHDNFMTWLSKQKNATRALKELVGSADSNPWFLGYDQQASQDAGKAVERRMDPKDMAGYLFSSGGWSSATLTGRKMAAKQACKWGSAAELEALAQGAKECFEKVCGKVSLTSKGVLGKQDKSGLDAAAIAGELGAGILGAPAAGEMDAGAMGLAEELKRRSSELIATKKDKAGAGADPEKIRKNLSDEKKKRLLALETLFRERSADRELLEAALGVTGWLADQPLAMCVTHSRTVPLLAMALWHSERWAVEALLGMEPNIWLAAAQCGTPNAAAFVCRSLGRFSGKDRQEMSKLLAEALVRGAWMDDKEDPKGRCVQHAKAAAEEGRADAEICKELVSAVESVLLEELLGAGAQAPAAPKKARGL